LNRATEANPAIAGASGFTNAQTGQGTPERRRIVHLVRKGDAGAIVPAIVLACFFAVNVYLWTLPMSDVLLLVVSAPLGAVFFAWLFWFVSRELSAES
jgi:hypothetical protein